MHSSTVVFIELHPVCDYFFIKLRFLAIFVTLLNLLGLSFLISKIRDFEWTNSWGTFYFQSTIFQTGTESMPLSDFNNMFCILSSRHLMRSVPNQLFQDTICHILLKLTLMHWSHPYYSFIFSLSVFSLGDICLSMFYKIPGAD